MAIIKTIRSRIRFAGRSIGHKVAKRPVLAFFGLLYSVMGCIALGHIVFVLSTIVDEVNRHGGLGRYDHGRLVFFMVCLVSREFVLNVHAPLENVALFALLCCAVAIAEYLRSNRLKFIVFSSAFFIPLIVVQSINFRYIRSVDTFANLPLLNSTFDGSSSTNSWAWAKPARIEQPAIEVTGVRATSVLAKAGRIQEDALRTLVSSAHLPPTSSEDPDYDPTSLKAADLEIQKEAAWVRLQYPRGEDRFRATISFEDGVCEPREQSADQGTRHESTVVMVADPDGNLRYIQYPCSSWQDRVAARVHPVIARWFSSDAGLEAVEKLYWTTILSLIYLSALWGGRRTITATQIACGQLASGYGILPTIALASCIFVGGEDGAVEFDGYVCEIFESRSRLDPDLARQECLTRVVTELLPPLLRHQLYDRIWMRPLGRWLR
jgi:hypothetical protein